MTDTPLEITVKMRELWMALPPSERIVRGALMFDAAREMILASLPPGLSPAEIRSNLYRRIYGRECPIP